MEEIIYLEPDEEITSVIDKIKNVPGRTIGLVVPREATLLQSVINLRLLVKEAQILGKEISIVTSDKIGRNLAAQVGLTVFSSVREEKPLITSAPPIPNSQEVIDLTNEQSTNEQETDTEGLKVHHFQNTKPIQWRSGQKPIFKSNPLSEKVKPTIPNNLVKKEADPRIKKLLWPIMSIIVLLAGVGAYLLIPKVTVKLQVASEDLNKSVPVIVTDKITASNPDEKLFPAEFIQSDQEKTQKFSATGKKNIGEKANGTITVSNAWESSPRQFSAGTKFSSSSKIFITTSNFTIPGSSIREGNLVAGNVTIKVEAEQPGDDYNVPAGRFTILGLSAAQQDKIYGTATNALSGGFTKEVQVVSQDDYDKSKKTLIDELTILADKDIESKAKGMKLLDSAKVTPEPEITSSARVDEEAKEFEMKVKIKRQAMVFNFTNYKEFLKTILADEAPTDKIIDIPTDEAVGLVVDKTNYDKGELLITNNIEAKIAPKISLDVIKSAVLGKSEQKIKEYISTQEDISSVNVEFYPSWWIKRTPELSRNVDVKIEYFSEEE